MVKVFSYTVRDRASGEDRTMTRMATRKFIRAMGGTILPDTEKEIEGSQVDFNGQVKIIRPAEDRKAE